MSRFNLLDEPWISVISKDGIQKDVSILDLFQNAASYVRIAGDTETQDFAVMRMLLAILQTVFSRYDADGQAIVPVDEKMKQTEEIEDDEEEQDAYEEALKNTWTAIWERRKFPAVLYQYLDCWREHFYLLDEKYPFYQVTKKELEGEKLIKGTHASAVAGKFINRSVSESGNKVSLFSPKISGPKNSNKDTLSAQELARWLITFQGYTGFPDKASFVKKDQNSSIGWLYDLGGIFMEGENLFETLMLNFIPVHPDSNYNYKVQKPCWEYSGREVMERLMKMFPITNLAELYTNWSRATFLDPELNLPGPVMLQSVILPAIDHSNQFLEPMTVWRFNNSGDNKGLFTPKKHMPEQSMWRSFGLITLKTSEENKQKRPAVVTQIIRVSREYGSRLLTIHAISMQAGDNAASRVPVDETADSLKLNDMLLVGDEEEWVNRINDTVNDTKRIVERVFRQFLTDLAEIRNMNTAQTDSFQKREIEELYQEIDEPFRQWLVRIKPDDSKEDKILKWKGILRKIVIRRVKDLVSQSGNRELTGIEKDTGILNAATAYLSFMRRINKVLPQEVNDLE